MSDLRPRYKKLFKLIRLAHGNGNASEAAAAMRQAAKLYRELDLALRRRHRVTQGKAA